MMLQQMSGRERCRPRRNDCCAAPMVMMTTGDPTRARSATVHDVGIVDCMLLLPPAGVGTAAVGTVLALDEEEWSPPPPPPP